ncbi:MAG: hypothetical protein U0X39_14310 [Bacteroidales bacterium]
MTDEIVNKVSERYTKIYEKITGEKFVRTDISDVEETYQEKLLNISVLLK